MQTLERNELKNARQAEKRLRRRARLHHARQRNATGMIRLFFLLLLGLSSYGLYFLKLLPGSDQIRQFYDGGVALVGEKVNQYSFEAGFQIQDISITGLKNLQENDVLSVLGFGAGVSSLNYDSQEAWKRLQGLKWVKQAKVQLLLPGTVIINIVEYEPYARIQEFGQHYLINGQGEILKYHEQSEYRNLPLFVGHGARHHAVSLHKAIKAFPLIVKRVQAGVRVDNRRWDLVMDNGHRLQLPETAYAAALARFSGLEKEYRLVDQDWTVIDMRLEGRLRLGRGDLPSVRGTKERFRDRG